MDKPDFKKVFEEQKSCCEHIYDWAFVAQKAFDEWLEKQRVVYNTCPSGENSRGWSEINGRKLPEDIRLPKGAATHMGRLVCIKRTNESVE